MQVPQERILLVDDEPTIRFAVEQFLMHEGFSVEVAGDTTAAEAAFRLHPADLVICDYVLPDGNALDLLPRLREVDSQVPVAILTGHGTIDLAVRAIKEGADQFLTKPVELPALLVMVRKLLENRRLRQRQLAGMLRQPRAAADPFTGTSSAIRDLAEQARRILGSDLPVLILGETGSGKGVLARWLHDHGPRSEHAFIDVNCAGLSRELLESELFGHDKGAFTSAVAAKPGLLEVAHHGTAFLDEIGDMDLQVQARLLKVVEEKRFRRVGSVSDRHVDVRLISATHQNLASQVAEQRFRSDLYFRISTLPLRVPALRERPEDIPLLAHRILDDFCADTGRRVELTSDAESALRAYFWPGNIRELRNVIERAVLLNSGSHLTARDLRFEAMASSEGGSEPPLTLAEVERRHIERVLANEQGNVARAAKHLGIPKSSLYEKLKRGEIRR